MSLVTLYYLAALIDLGIMVLSLSTNTRKSYLLSGCCFFAAYLSVTYIKAATLSEYLQMSIMHSLYFSGIDALLLCLSAYTLYYTGQKYIAGSFMVDRCIKLYAAVDILILLINPIKEIAISYTNPTVGHVHWVHQPKFLFLCHVCLGYILIVLTIYGLLKKASRIPKIYRTKYKFLAFSIALMVIMNGVSFVLSPDGYYDLSIILYSAIMAILYFLDFIYIQRATQNIARQLMLEEMSSPTILFDYEDKVIVFNSGINTLLDRDVDSNLTLKQFLKLAQLDREITDFEAERSLILYRTVYGTRKVYRCDFKPLIDKSTGDRMGHLFIFTDSSQDVDLLTDFNSRTRYFKWCEQIKNHAQSFPTMAIVFDINELSQINSRYGHEQGDQAIRLLASSIRDASPAGSYFARLNDANLLAVCPGIDNPKIDQYIGNIRDRIYGGSNLPFNFDFAYGSCQMNNAEEKMTSSVDTAISALFLKKMLDNRSLHASLLNSLVQVQQESDSSTEEHVQRTNQLGTKLGKRLGYSERQLSELALLCLMHDIGKLGVPLEILNKPGKLTENEWEILKSHAEKGYRIAKASKELSVIADYILYHHERWDGKGYPDGLRAEAIPLLSRVIAIVDAYDAMTNDRAYRKRLSISQALEEIRKNAGVQFDPMIATEFIKMIKEETGISPDGSSTDFVKPIITKESGKKVSWNESENLHLLHYSRYTLDENDYVISADPVFEEITGYNEKDIQELHLNQIDLIPPEDRKIYTTLTSEMVLTDGFAYLEHRIMRKDGSYIDVFCMGRRYFDSAISKMRNSIFITDISKSKSIRKLIDNDLVSMKRSITAYEGLARRDSLTGILNNNAFANDAQELLFESGKQHLLMMIDLDNFKSYNDVYGHPEGDELLKAVSLKIKESIGERGIYGRMGGDEFAAMLSLSREMDVEAVEEEVSFITKSLCERTRSFAHNLSVSIGAKLNEEQNSSFATLYREADLALYEAKKAGKARYIFKN